MYAMMGGNMDCYSGAMWGAGNMGGHLRCHLPSWVSHAGGNVGGHSGCHLEWAMWGPTWVAIWGVFLGGAMLGPTWVAIWGVVLGGAMWGTMWVAIWGVVLCAP